MISRSLKNVLTKQQHLAKAQGSFVQTPARAAGGGPKKPPMPSSERDFDIVLVGKYEHTFVAHILPFYRWHERDRHDEVLAN